MSGLSPLSDRDTEETLSEHSMLDICEGFFGHSCLKRMLSDREMLLGVGMGALIGGVSGSVACIFMHRD